MSHWINLPAIGYILLLGLVFGAGLPALVAVGLKLLDTGAGADVGTGATTGGDGSAAVSANPARQGAAYLCFLIVLAAIAFGIYKIVVP
ncbi:MAG: hypothetical protein ABS81_29435 [Pseudonocardia sp. SCN 72-86]|nr:MAG: hypothetical protein ABS81_29435 [Pseudonocardia sp. SCN 72-86]